MIRLNFKIPEEIATPVGLPFHEDEYSFNNKDVTVTGWGESRWLMYASGTVLPQSSCLKYYPVGHLSNSHFCVKMKEEWGSRCLSDFGSPVVNFSKGRAILVGLESFDNCYRQVAGVFTRVSLYAEEIQYIMDKYNNVY